MVTHYENELPANITNRVIEEVSLKSLTLNKAFLVNKFFSKTVT